MMSLAIAADHTRENLMIWIIFTIIFTLIITAIFTHYRCKTKKTKEFKIVILLLVIAICFQSAYYLVYDENYPSGDGGYYGLSVHMDLGTIMIDDLNLTNSAISNITNETFTLVIEVEDSSSIKNSTYNFYKYGYNQGVYPAAIEPVLDNEELFLNDDFSFVYNFSIYWTINSTEPAIQNLKLLGNENMITGHFVTDGWNINVTIDEEYCDLISVVQDPSYETIIELPFEINFIMRSQWVC